MSRTERRFTIDKRSTLQVLRRRCHREPCLVDPEGKFSVGQRVVTRATHNSRRNTYHEKCWESLISFG